MRIGKIILVIILCCFSFGVNASEFMFKHLEVKDGLSNNQVTDIFRDSKGFMWFATASGLNRYDGYQIRIFRCSDSDSETLPDNFIKGIQEDNNGNLWVLTGKGYAIFNPLTEIFNRDVRSWLWEIGIDGSPSLVYVDHNKHIWFYVADKGCYLYIPESQLLYPLLFDAQQLPQGKITAIKECAVGVLIIYDNGTLICLDANTNKVKWELQDIPKELGADKRDDFKLFVDRDGDIWAYGRLGVWVYNPEVKKWQVSLNNITRQYADRGVSAIAQDRQGQIWIGKKQDGIDILDKMSGAVKTLYSTPGDERSLSGNNILSLFQDANEIMWVGTNRKGVSYYNESIYKFRLEPLGDVNCIEEDVKGFVCLGTNDAGLLYWNSATGEVEVFDSAASRSGTITCLLKARDGKIWIGMHTGLDCDNNGSVTHYKNTSGQKNSLAHDNVRALAEDRDGNIWIGTAGGGVQSLNPKTGTFTTYNVSSAGLLSDDISSLCVGKENILWIGTAEGMVEFDLKTLKGTNLVGTKSGKEHFTNTNISQVYEDSRGLIWLGTREGLNIYNPKTDEINVLDMSKGLSSQIIAGIVEDDNKNLWVTTARGVTHIIPSADANTGRFSFRCYVYDNKDGLQSCEFNQRSIKKLSTGEILMGGLYGVNRFQPDEIKYNKILPKVVFTRLYLFNDEVMIRKKYDNRVILDKALNLEDEIELDYDQNIFTIHFVTDNHILPEKMKYAYRLEGFSDEWLDTSEGKVTYTNLSPGTYTLKVKAINGDGYSGDEESSLKIVVHPPFWLSVWAYLVYIVLLVIIVLWIRYFIRRSVRRHLDGSREEKKAESRAAAVPTAAEAVEEKKEAEEWKDGNEDELSKDLIEIDGILMLRSQHEADLKKEKERVKQEHARRAAEARAEHPELADVPETAEEEADEDETEDIPAVSAIAPQRAMIIQLTEEDDDRIVTHILPPEALPDMATATGFRRKMANSAKRVMEGRREAELESDSNSTAVISADDRLIDQAVKYVEDNISRSDFSVEELSRQLGMSRVNLYKKLVALTGKTPIEFIRVIRLKRAAQMLRDGRHNVSEIAYQVGFNNPKYFTKYFKEEFGVLPSAYPEQGGK